MSDIANILNKRDRQFSDEESVMFENHLRRAAIPPVRGKITRGKLKWRGIKRIVEFNKSWLEQRGKRITKVYVR